MYGKAVSVSLRTDSQSTKQAHTHQGSNPGLVDCLQVMGLRPKRFFLGQAEHAPATFSIVHNAKGVACKPNWRSWCQP